MLNQAADLLDGLGWIHGIVQTNQVDLAAIDSALEIERFEERLMSFPARPICRSGSAVRHGLPDLDFGVSDTGAVTLGLCSGQLLAKTKAEDTKSGD